jgi:hypothetical protein
MLYAMRSVGRLCFAAALYALLARVLRMRHICRLTQAALTCFPLCSAGSWAAQDPLWQDHAPRATQDCCQAGR